MLIYWFNWKMIVVILGVFLVFIVFFIVFLFLWNYFNEKGLVFIGGEIVEEGKGIVEKKVLNIIFLIYNFFNMECFFKKRVLVFNFIFCYLWFYYYRINGYVFYFFFI